MNNVKPVARRRPLDTFRVSVVGEPKLPVAHVARALDSLGLVIGPDGGLYHAGEAPQVAFNPATVGKDASA